MKGVNNYTPRYAYSMDIYKEGKEGFELFRRFI